MKNMAVVLFMGWILLVDGFAGEHRRFASLVRSAQEGNAESMIDLGLAYFYGEDILKDPFKAKCWIQKAYTSGSDRAEKIWEDLKLWQYAGNCDTSVDGEGLPAYVQGDMFTDPVTGIIFVHISGGCFEMGCHLSAGKCDKDENPLHKVCLDGAI